MWDTWIIQAPGDASTRESDNRPNPRCLFHSGCYPATGSSGSSATVPVNSVTDIRPGLSCESSKCWRSGRLGLEKFPSSLYFRHQSASAEPETQSSTWSFQRKKSSLKTWSSVGLSGCDTYCKLKSLLPNYVTFFSPTLGKMLRCNGEPHYASVQVQDNHFVCPIHMIYDDICTLHLTHPPLRSSRQLNILLISSNRHNNKGLFEPKKEKNNT